MPNTRSSPTTNPPAAVPADADDAQKGKVDNGGLPSDGRQTVSQPEPQRESAAAQRDRPATGITPGGTPGGRRI